jgi:hypothetical protein
MFTIFLAAYVLGDFNLTPYVQTHPKITSRPATSHKPPPSGKGQVVFYDPGTDGKQEVVHWKVTNNKLSFFYKGGLVVTDAIIKLTKDSLVLYRRDKVAGVVGYSRFVRLK